MARERRLLWSKLASKSEKYATLAEPPPSATTITTTTTITSAMASQIHLLEKYKDRDEAHHLPKIHRLRKDKYKDKGEDEDKDKDENKDKDLQSKSNQAMDN